MIKIEQLYYLLQIEKFGSIHKAAASIYKTDAALSTAIKQLEKEVGYEILERTYRGIRFTEKGKEVVRLAEQIFILHKEILEMGVQEEEAVQRVPLLVEQRVLRLLSRKLMNPSAKIFEYFEVTETENVYLNFEENLKHNTILLCILSESKRAELEKNHNIQIYYLYESKQYPVSCKNTRWIKSSQNSISMEEYIKLPKIKIRITCETEIDISENVVLETDDPAIYEEAIQKDLGIGIITKFASDIYTVDSRKLKIYKPFEESVYITIITNNKSGEQAVQYLETVIKGNE